MGRLKRLWRARRPGLVSGPLYHVASILGRSLRVEARGFDGLEERTVFGGWHGRTFAFATHFRGRGWWVIISRSRDGDMQNAIFERLGYRTARGSTGRDGERAAVRAIKALRAGGALAMTPDGPRGPAETVQPGVLHIAQRSGARIVPVGVACASAWVVKKSWDRYVIPKPFSRALLLAGEPIEVPPGADLESLRLRLQDAIAHAQAEAERALGLPVLGTVGVEGP